MANRLLYLGLGAALMYLYDPQSGRRRRADLKNQVDAAARRVHPDCDGWHLDGASGARAG